MVRDGQIAITNSDSDSMDAEDDDDDDDDDDLDALVKARRKEWTASAVPRTPAAAADQTDPRMLRSSRIARPKNKAQRTESPPTKKYRTSISSLVRESRAEAAWYEKKQEYERQEQEEQENDKQREAQSGQDQQQALEHVAGRLQGEDGGSHEKMELVRAMKRVDALQEEVHYHFFKPTNVDVSILAFPVESLAGNKAWSSVLRGI